MYGLDRELAEKRAAKYSVTDEAAVRNISACHVNLSRPVFVPFPSITCKHIDEPISGDFGEAFKDGTKLCRLINTLAPGAVKKINESKLPFKQMENISCFLQAARAMGLAEFDCFCTPDLYESKDVGAVVRSLIAFARVAELREGYSGPRIGEELSIAGSSVSPSESPLPPPVLTPAPAPAVTKPASRPVPPVPARGNASVVPSSATPSSPLPKYGLDAELAAKAAAKYDTSMEAEAKQWIEAVTETPFPSGVSFIEALKDGVLLCTLANCIRPGIIKKVNKPGMPFREMENVSAFLQAARAMAVPEFDLFSTPDLYEGKGPFQVVKCIHALGRTLQATMPDYSGPKLGVKMAEARVLDESVKSGWVDGTAIPSHLSRGSHGVMERAEVSRARDIDFGAQSAGGTGDAASVSFVGKGSSEVMDRVYISRSNDVTFGHDASAK